LEGQTGIGLFNFILFELHVVQVRSANDALSLQLQSSVANMWGGEERKITKHAGNLTQVCDIDVTETHFLCS
jgi:hypothetical protein